MNRFRPSLLAAALAATLALVAGCNAAKHADPGSPDADGWTEGTVRVTGTIPGATEVILEAPSDRVRRLAGERREELVSLSGVTIAVWGETAGDTIRVERYRVVSVDGLPAVGGVVVRDAGGTWLDREDGPSLRLLQLPDGIQAGDRIWVQGDREEEALRVRAYGRIAGGR